MASAELARVPSQNVLLPYTCTPSRVFWKPRQAMAAILAPFTEEPREAQPGRCTALRTGALGLAARRPPPDGPPRPHSAPLHAQLRNGPRGGSRHRCGARVPCLLLAHDKAHADRTPIRAEG